MYCEPAAPTGRYPPHLKHLRVRVNFNGKKFMIVIPSEANIRDCKAEIVRVYRAISGSSDDVSICELQDSFQFTLYDEYEIGMLLHDMSEVFAITDILQAPCLQSSVIGRNINATSETIPATSVLWRTTGSIPYVSATTAVPNDVNTVTTPETVPATTLPDDVTITTVPATTASVNTVTTTIVPDDVTTPETMSTTTASGVNTVTTPETITNVPATTASGVNTVTTPVPGVNTVPTFKTNARTAMCGVSAAEDMPATPVLQLTGSLSTLAPVVEGTGQLPASQVFVSSEEGLGSCARILPWTGTPHILGTRSDIGGEVVNMSRARKRSRTRVKDASDSFTESDATEMASVASNNTVSFISPQRQTLCNSDDDDGSKSPVIELKCKQINKATELRVSSTANNFSPDDVLSGEQQSNAQGMTKGLSLLMGTSKRKASNKKSQLSTAMFTPNSARLSSRNNRKLSTLLGKRTRIPVNETSKKRLSLSKEEESMAANITSANISTLLDNEDLW